MRERIHTHYITLIHGWMGCSDEMSYVEQSIHDNINKRSSTCVNTTNPANDDGTNIKICNIKSNVHKTYDGVEKGGQRVANEVQEFIQNDLEMNIKKGYLYCRGDDGGVSKEDDSSMSRNDGDGGNDTNDTDTSHQEEYSMKKSSDNHYDVHVTISLVGHSLGGLYARYAIAMIPNTLELMMYNKLPDTNTVSTKPPSANSNEQKHSTVVTAHLHRNIFLTTATPHLGQSFNCFYKAPRFVEILFAKMLRQTGLDLFVLPPSATKSASQKKSSDESKGKKASQAREADREEHLGGCQEREGEEKQFVELEQTKPLLFQMATNYEKFLRPMTMFQKRVAFVNVFKSDFQVHTPTASFLSDRSTQPHVIEEENYVQGEKEGLSFVVATCTTEQNDNILQSKAPSLSYPCNRTSYKEHISTLNLIMSNKLDALGWTKVFVDARHYSPIKTMSKKCKPQSRELWNNFVKEKSKSTNGSDMKSRHDAPNSMVNNPNKAVSLLSGGFDDLFKHEEEVEEQGVREEESFIVTTQASSSGPQAKKSITVVESKEILSFMTKNDRVQIPLGHNLIVANSKTKSYRKSNKNGMPIVDKIVHQLLSDILKFDVIE